MDQESFEQTVSQFKKSVKDIGKKESPSTSSKKSAKDQAIYKEPRVIDEPAIQDIPINQDIEPKEEANDKESISLKDQPKSKGPNLLVLFSIATILGLSLGVLFAVLLVSGELDLPLKDVKQVFKTITAIGSHLK